MRQLRTALPFMNTRAVSLRDVGPLAQTLEANGIDFFWTWDQLTFLVPPGLWANEGGEMARLMPDLDSFHDPWVACAVAAGSTSDLGLLIGGTDATRRGPAELLQAMLSLADLSDGKAVVCLGAGEAKQIIPFGYQASEKFKRLEDVLRIVGELQDCTGPIDHDGSSERMHPT